MQLKPKPLQEGWFRRTLVSAMAIFFKAPAEWIIIGVVAPILMIYAELFFIKAMIWSAMITSGAILSLRCDHGENRPLLDIVKHLFNNPLLTTLDLFASISILVAFDFYFVDLAQILQSHYISSGLSLLMLEVSYCFVLVPYVLARVIQRSLQRLKKPTPMKAHLSQSGIPTFFTLHVMIDMSLDWKEACALSLSGYWAMCKNRWIVYFMLALTCAFPPAAIIVFPWLYSVYKELFWQTGVTIKTSDNERQIQKPALSGS